jgi:type II secretory pathway component PulL
VKTCFLDWAESELHVYFFDKKKGKYMLSDAATVPVEGEFIGETVLSAIQSPCDNVFLSIPATQLSIREISFPFHDKSKIKSTISYELEGLLLGNAADYSIDHIITESSEDESRVLALCMEKARLRELISSLSPKGLDPRVITSLDIRIAEGKSDRILSDRVRDREARAQAAREEVMNPTLNLRQDELTYVRDIERFRKVVHLSIALLLVLLLFIGSNMHLRYTSLKEEHAILKKEMSVIYQKAFPEDRKIVDPLRQFRGNLNRLTERKAVLAGVPVLNILRTLAGVERGDIILREFNADEKNIIVKGSSPSFEEVESYRNILSSFFDEVRITDSKTSADEDIIFSIAMKGKQI